MSNWKAWSHPELKLRFRYPDPTPQQRQVKVARIARQGGVRVHLTSPGFPELYFEAALYPGVTDAQAKAAFLQGLRAGSPAPQIGEPEGVSISGLRGEGIALRWPDRSRQVYFLNGAADVYRIILDPGSQLNWDILATLIFYPQDGAERE